MTSIGSPVVARVRRNRSIFPLVDDVRALLFGGPTLAELQEREAGGFAVEDVNEDDVLSDRYDAVFGDDVVFSHATLRALFDARPPGAPAPLRAAIRAGTPLWHASARLTGHSVDCAVDLVCGPVGGRRAKDVLDDASIAVAAVADEDSSVDVDVAPYGVAPHVLRLPRVARLLGQPRHWAHVLELSLACLHSFPRAHGKVVRGRKTFVHPTATVIDSVLGDGVRVEAGASVIDSVIGADTIVADASVVHTSVIGPRCRTLVDTHLRRVVAMPGSTLSNLDMQDAVFGREIFLTTGVAFFADAPGANVVVDGKDSGRPVLSGAIGARALLGSRALFRSGIAVPPGALIVARPGEALGRLDEKGLAKSTARIGDPRHDV